MPRERDNKSSQVKARSWAHETTTSDKSCARFWSSPTQIMRGARLVTPNGDLVIMSKTWLQHSTFLTTAIEYGDDAIPHVPVPFEKGVLEDLAAWCQLLD